jgi:hypothetical protein
MLIMPFKKRDVCSFVVLMANEAGNNRGLEKMVMNFQVP